MGDGALSSCDRSRTSHARLAFAPTVAMTTDQAFKS
jgi:hypothetical protein